MKRLSVIAFALFVLSFSTGQIIVRHAKVTSAPPAAAWVLEAADDFVRANSATLGANYTAHYFAMPGINSNGAWASSIGANQGAFWSARSWAAKQRATVVLADMASGADYSGVGIHLSGTGATATGYIFFTDGTTGSSHSFLERLDAGSTEVELQAFTMTATNADSISIEWDANNIKCYKNGTQVGTTYTLASEYTTGSPGALFYRTNSITNQITYFRAYEWH